MLSFEGTFQDKSIRNKRCENDDSGEDLDSIFPEETLLRSSPEFSPTDDIYLDVDTAQIRPCEGDMTMSLDKPKTEDPQVPLASLGILKSYGRGIKRLGSVAFGHDPQQRLSTEDILRLAGEDFVQTSSSKVVLPHDFGKKLSVFNLSSDQTKDIDKIQKLLSAAEKYGQKNYDRARTFLDQCDKSSSNNGNQIDRMVHYFAIALREKINKETGRIVSKASIKKQAVQVDENIMKASAVILSFHQAIPLSQISVYAGMQAIVERVVNAKRVHIIDLEIRSGMHASVLMQALADRVECPIELLKITAVTTKSKWIIEKTGERLKAFAKSINMPFVFNIVMVQHIWELKEGLFNIEPGEKVAINALYALRTMIGRQDELEYLMGILKSINPCVMVVTEVEGKHNSPIFVNRFIEALFYFGAYFDCIEDCIDRDSPLRMQCESTYLGFGIRNMIVAEGDERTIRHVNLDIWRAFFSRYDMIEEQLSSSSVIQASLVAKTYKCWNSCTMYMDGNSLLVGWKGMPLQHVSAWRFGQSKLNLFNKALFV